MRGGILCVAFICAATLFAGTMTCAAADQSSQPSKQDHGQAQAVAMAMKEAQEQIKKVAEFEPTTPVSRFMGGFVSAFLIFSILALVFGGMLAAGLGADEIWMTILKYYAALTSYLLLNYVVWVGLKMLRCAHLDLAVSVMLAISGLLFMYLPFSIHRESLRDKKKHQIPSRVCGQCGSTVHYDNPCWNCKAEKPV